MTTNFGAFPLFPLSVPRTDPSPLCAAHTGFLTHKYLLVAILQCLQERHRRPAPTPSERDDTAVHLCLREPSAEREVTPCIVLREHAGRGDLSVTRLLVERLDLQKQPLANWMRALLPPEGQPDRDTLHFAMAPTLPGVPMLVHSIDADGEATTHMFSEGTWSPSKSNAFLLRAIRYAQLVATAIPLTGGLRRVECARPPAQVGSPAVREAGAGDPNALPCDLSVLGQRYDHIAVHAALNELKAFRRSQLRVRAAPSSHLVASGR